MSEESSQEKTHEPTQKRVDEARQRGDVPRSRELTSLFLVLMGASLLLSSGGNVVTTILEEMHRFFAMAPGEYFDTGLVVRMYGVALKKVFISLLPLFITTAAFSILSSIALGGLVFSFDLLTFNMGKLNPLEGIKRMFALSSLVELTKALLKFFIILGGGILLIYWQYHQIFHLSELDVIPAIWQGMWIIGYSFVMLALVLALIAGVDVPYQLWQSHEKLRMTTQELQDEFKETEGKPEVKSALRRRLRELANSRMLKDVPKASVVITNPTHYAVAVRYEEKNMQAPIVLAKGMGHIAEQIRNLAKENKITIYSAPPLARALYHSTEVGHEIPAGLYIAVARVLVYVYQLRQYQVGMGEFPIDIDNLPIPKDLQYPEKVEV